MFVKELVSDMILLFMSNESDRLMIITGKVLCFWRSLNCFVQHRVNYYHQRWWLTLINRGGAFNGGV